MLDGVKLMSWLDQIREARAGFQGFTYILSRLSQIVPFMSSSEFGNEVWEKSNLHTFDSRVLYL